jgi:adenosylmethionine-8-amino-7-oxononanoate aminotransferase
MTHVFYRAPAARYPVVDRGEGIYLWDTEGRQYLDGASGALVANLGHGRAEIAEAMARQASRVAFAHTLRFTSAAQEELARRVAELLPYGLSHTYPVSGGSEAVETAVKMARQYFLEIGQPQRFRIVAQSPSYHGNTLGALAASGHLGRRDPYRPLLHPAFVHVPQPQATCRPASGPCPCLAAIDAALQRVGPETVAAVIWEPISGSSDSAFVPHPGFLRGLLDLCRTYGILFIADEVMTGFGRTGRWLGVEHEAAEPDLITCAKGLSGGYAPLGAVVATDRVYRAIAEGSGRFAHGFTYGGHPVACAAGAKALEILERERLVERAATMGERLAAGLAQLQQRHPVIKTVRGRGLMQGLVLETDRATPGGLAARLGQLAFDRGLIIYPGSGGSTSRHGDHVLIGPPLIIDESGLQDLLTRLDESLTALERQRTAGA